MRESKASMQLKFFVFFTEVRDDLRNIISKRYVQFLGSAVMMIMCVTPVFADGILTDMLDSLTNLYNEIMPVFNVIALILGIAAGLAWAIAFSEKSAELGKKWLIRIAVAWVIVTILPYLLVSVRNLLGDSATGTGIEDLKNIRPGTS